MINFCFRGRKLKANRSYKGAHTLPKVSYLRRVNGEDIAKLAWISGFAMPV